MDQEITITYRVSGNVNENEVRQQAQAFQQSAPSNWQIKEAHLQSTNLLGSTSSSGSSSN